MSEQAPRPSWWVNRTREEFQKAAREEHARINDDSTFGTGALAGKQPRTVAPQQERTC